MTPNGQHFADGIFKHIFVYEISHTFILIHWSLFPMVILTKTVLVFQITAWCKLIICTNDIIYWHMYASLRLDELIKP